MPTVGGGRVNVVQRLDRLACCRRSLERRFGVWFSLQQLLALDDALQRLEALDPQKARIVELRYFGGLTIEETAEALQVSPATIKRDWSMARAWLRSEISN